MLLKPKTILLPLLMTTIVSLSAAYGEEGEKFLTHIQAFRAPSADPSAFQQALRIPKQNADLFGIAMGSGGLTPWPGQYTNSLGKYLAKLKAMNGGSTSALNDDDPDAINREDQIPSGPPVKPFKKGDQIFLVFESHGSVRTLDNSDPNFGPLHSILLDERNAYDLAEGGKIQDSLLGRLVDLAEKKEVKLAILDLTCGSGNTQYLLKGKKLTSNSACVISTTSPYQFSQFPGFGESLKRELLKKTPGTNLEDLFLKAMLDSKTSWTAEFPMIGTEEGAAVYKILEALIPYLRFQTDDVGKAGSIPDYLKSSAGEQCERDRQFTELMKNLNDLARPLKLDRNPDFQELLRLINDSKLAHDRMSTNLTGRSTPRDRDAFNRDISQTRSNSVQIGKKIRDFYLGFYKKAQQENLGKPNPCRAFTL